MTGEVEIIGFDSDINGYGFFNEKRLTFRYASPGDLVVFETRGSGKRKYNKILEHQKKETIDYGCKFFTQCGGCRARNIPYETQFDLKTRVYKKKLFEISGDRIQFIPARKTENYRNRMDFAVFPEEIGLHQEGNFRRIIDIDHCNLQKEIANRELNALRPHLLPLAYHRKSEEGYLKYLTIRTSSSGELMSILTFTLPFRDTEMEKEFAEVILKHSLADHILFCFNRIKSEVSAVGEFKVLKGNSFYTEEILGNKIEIPFDSFAQPNPDGFLPILEFIGKKTSLLKKSILFDLFSGSGFFSILFGSHFSALYGMDSVPASIQKANEILREKFPDKKIDFRCIDLYQTKELFLGDPKNSFLIMDPPRNGVGKSLLEILIQSEVQDILYVSCNPNSQLTDLETLLPFYNVVDGVVTDPYPHTPHLESVLHLSKK